MISFESDTDALELLEEAGFNTSFGRIRPPNIHTVIIDDEELAAINYLIEEWDYVYYDSDALQKLNDLFRDKS